MIVNKSGPKQYVPRAPALAADGQLIEADDDVLIRAKVTGASGPLNDLSDTGVVAIKVDGYLDSTLEGCIPPNIVEAVVKKAPKKGEPPCDPPTEP